MTSISCAACAHGAAVALVDKAAPRHSGPKTVWRRCRHLPWMRMLPHPPTVPLQLRVDMMRNVIADAWGSGDMHDLDTRRLRAGCCSPLYRGAAAPSRMRAHSSESCHALPLRSAVHESHKSDFRLDGEASSRQELYSMAVAHFGTYLPSVMQCMRG
jgi:hypothetical protein